jgi:hypothetical protein
MHRTHCPDLAFALRPRADVHDPHSQGINCVDGSMRGRTFVHRPREGPLDWLTERPRRRSVPAVSQPNAHTISSPTLHRATGSASRSSCRRNFREPHPRCDSRARHGRCPRTVGGPAARAPAFSLGRPGGLGFVVGRRSNRQDGADRLDSVRLAMAVDERHRQILRRATSAWATYADAFRRISRSRAAARDSPAPTPSAAAAPRSSAPGVVHPTPRLDESSAAAPPAGCRTTFSRYTSA